MKEKLIPHTGGIIEVSKVLDANVSKDVFYKFVKVNSYYKVGPGMYVSPDEIVDELLVLHKRCPSGIISHDEALYHYGFIDREPVEHTITVYSGYNASRLRRSGYKVYYVNKNLLDIGKTDVTDSFGNIIPVYDMERTVVDLVRNRSQFELQDFNTALKEYIRRSDKNLIKLADYAKAFRLDKVLQKYLEVLL